MKYIKHPKTKKQCQISDEGSIYGRITCISDAKVAFFRDKSEQKVWEKEIPSAAEIAKNTENNE